ncbi:MAG: hypothetical protein JRG80_02530 [Deltaproteobacteria bacterium]|nr:hypothetical protein [Deltaproteobacteria bacterium]
MAIHRIVLSSVLLIVTLSGCGSDDVTVITPGRAMGAPPPAATTETTRAEPTETTPQALGESRKPASERRTDRGNQAPVIVGIVIEPFGEVTVRHDIVAKPRAKDIENDEIEFRYTWRINGARSFADENTLPKSEFRRGDWIDLTVVASDGSSSSEPLESKPFEVTNAAPTITSAPGGFDEQGALQYQVLIEDPDDEKGFEYRLIEGPGGMRIDATSGLVSWQPSKQQTGTHSTRIEVVDKKGGKAWQSFDLELDLVSGVAPAAPSPN